VATALLVAVLLWPFGYIGRLRLHPPAHTQASFKTLGCSYNWTCGLFQLTHMSCDDHAVQLIKQWRPKRRQNVITALTTLPQGWVSTRKLQCTTAITLMWTEFIVGLSWELHYLDMRLSNGGQWGDKRAIISPPRWVYAQLLYVCVTAW